MRYLYAIATIGAYVNGGIHAAIQQDSQAIASFGAGALLTLIATIYYAYQDAKQ